MAKPKDIQGQKFGRLTILEYMGYEHSSHRWKVKCDCGTIFVTDQSSIIRGLTQSCGCLQKERARAANAKRFNK